MTDEELKAYLDNIKELAESLTTSVANVLEGIQQLHEQLVLFERSVVNEFDHVGDEFRKSADENNQFAYLLSKIILSINNQQEAKFGFNAKNDLTKILFQTDGNADEEKALRFVDYANAEFLRKNPLAFDDVKPFSVIFHRDQAGKAYGCAIVFHGSEFYLGDPNDER